MPAQPGAGALEARRRLRRLQFDCRRAACRPSRTVWFYRLYEGGRRGEQAREAILLALSQCGAGLDVWRPAETAEECDLVWGNCFNRQLSARLSPDAVANHLPRSSELSSKPRLYRLLSAAG